MHPPSSNRTPICCRRAGSHSGLLLWALFALLAAPGVCGIATAPMEQHLEIKPGTAGDGHLTLTNVARGPDDKVQKLRLELVDFSVTADGALLFGEEHKGPRSAVAWTKLDAGAISLRPNESREIGIHISVPSSANGDYWCAVMVTLENGQPEQKGVNVTLRTASGLFISASRGPHTARAQVLDAKFEFSGPKVAAELPPGAIESAAAPDRGYGLGVVASIANTGVVEYLGTGTATIYSAARRVVATLPLHSGRKQILPGHTRELRGELPMAIPAGSYTLRFNFKSEGGRGNQLIKEIPMTVTRAQAEASRSARPQSYEGLLIAEPAEVGRTVARGGVSSMALKISNNGGGSVRGGCRLEGAGWVRVSPSEFTLGPGGSRNLTLQLSVPKGSPPGPHEETLFIEFETARLGDDDNLQTLAVPIHITPN